MKKFALAFFLVIPVLGICQTKTLSIEKIMQDPKWIGTSPSGASWSISSDTLFFLWNPDKQLSDSLYFITLKNHTPQKASVAQKTNLLPARSVTYNREKTALVFSMGGDVFYKQLNPAKTVRITQTADYEFNPAFTFNGKKVAYQKGQDLFAWDIATGETVQLINIQKEKEKGNVTKDNLTAEEKWLKNEQLQYIEVLKERNQKKEKEKQYNDLLDKNEIQKIYSGNKRVSGMEINPDGNFISYTLYQSPTAGKNTIVPDYVTESGYTTDIPGRKKVGEPQGDYSFFVFDRKKDTAIEIKADMLDGIRDIPEFYKDYPKEYERLKKENAVRPVFFAQSQWSPDGKYLMLDIRSQDNKDRWLMAWNAGANQLLQISHQHDEAWIDGPGTYNIGWLSDHEAYYQSEETGYSHLYTFDLSSKKKKQLTSGNYEVQSAKLSPDKKYFYIITNEVEPGQSQFYRLSIADKKQEKITTMVGGNDVAVSPDGEQLAILYSYTNKPWELYLQKNEPGTQPEQITNKAQSEEWKSYPWRDPEVITFKARDGSEVHARVYKPRNAIEGAPAVVFVHGAGYLQNAHKWWSLYFREYMFHNFLADQGYYVIDADYRGSAGYGRDWRTGIYRYMGGKDLSDNVDAAKYLVEKYKVDPSRIGIYGGSYGGFITLMAMFTTPDVFAAGAGLRSVTEWANYNNGYTSNILNEPYNDSIAYRRSSPIYFAEGLKGNLLMCHGLIDQNVHVQDIIKLSQRLIELKKENWQLALYPLEDHGFVEPTSWMDEYKRIYKLFEETLKKKKP